MYLLIHSGLWFGVALLLGSHMLVIITELCERLAETHIQWRTSFTCIESSPQPSLVLWIHQYTVTPQMNGSFWLYYTAGLYATTRQGGTCNSTLCCWVRKILRAYVNREVFGKLTIGISYRLSPALVPYSWMPGKERLEAHGDKEVEEEVRVKTCLPQRPLVSMYLLT